MSKFSGLATNIDSTAKMPLLHPSSGAVLTDKDGTQGFIELRSADSRVAQKALREFQRQMTNRRGRATLTPEQSHERTTALLAALTVGWHLVSLDGEHINVDFTQANAHELYADDELVWLREAVDAFAYDRSNFGQASSKTSSPGPKNTSDSSAE